MDAAAAGYTTLQRTIMGLVGLVVLLGTSFIGVKYSTGYFDPGYELVARFDEAGQNLDTESDVKIRGVNVGKVQSIELLEGGVADVTLFIDDGIPVPETTTAVVRPISVFGPKYIDLLPGEGEGEGGDAMLGEGDEIAETASPVELNDVLVETYGILEVIDPVELATILDTFGTGLRGLGPELGSILTNGGEVLSAAAENAPETRQLLANLAVMSEILADQSESLVATAGNLNEVLPVITDRPADLNDLLTGTARVANEVASLLEDNRDGLDETIVGGAELTNAVFPHRGGLRATLDAVQTYLGNLSATIRPGETASGDEIMLTHIKFFGPTNPCQFISLPLCSAGPGPPTIGGPAGPGLPPITVPELPPVTLPPITLPPITLPPITVPPVTLPPVTVPPPPSIPGLDDLLGRGS